MENKLFSAVVVFYNPEQAHVENALRLSTHLDLIIVDNSPEPFEYDIPDASIIRFNANLGIATALNKGLESSKDAGYEFTVLLDQDSDVDPDLVFNLVDEARLLTQTRTDKIAVVSPSYFDKSLGIRNQFIYVDDKAFTRKPSEGTEPIDASFTISSGSVINNTSLDEIGMMDDDLFIDLVDIEWCLRAKSHGYKVLGLPTVLMVHEIGCKPVNVFGRKFANHSPIRHYFYFRNSIELMRRDYIPKAFKRVEFWKLLPRFCVYALFTDNRFAQAKMMSKGILHGITRKLGPYR